MNAIKALVQNGRVETDGPIDLPDGTEILILPCESADTRDGWEDTPEGIAAWLQWYDSLEPLVFTSEELAAWRTDQQERKDWETEHSDDRERKLRGLWK